MYPAAKRPFISSAGTPVCGLVRGSARVRSPIGSARKHGYGRHASPEVGSNLLHSGGRAGQLVERGLS